MTAVDSGYILSWQKATTINMMLIFTCKNQRRRSAGGLNQRAWKPETRQYVNVSDSLRGGPESSVVLSGKVKPKLQWAAWMLEMPVKQVMCQRIWTKRDHTCFRQESLRDRATCGLCHEPRISNTELECLVWFVLTSFCFALIRFFLLLLFFIPLLWNEKIYFIQLNIIEWLPIMFQYFIGAYI